MKRTTYSEKECRKNESAGVAAPDTLRNTCHQQSIRQDEHVQLSLANAKLFARRCGSPCTILHGICPQNLLFNSTGVFRCVLALGKLAVVEGSLDD